MKFTATTTLTLSVLSTMPFLASGVTMSSSISSSSISSTGDNNNNNNNNNKNMYMGKYDPVPEIGSFALCGATNSSIRGCLAAPLASEGSGTTGGCRGHSSRAMLGQLSKIGTETQMWQFDGGLLKANYGISSSSSSSGSRGLGTSPSSSELSRPRCLGPTQQALNQNACMYQLTLQDCPDDDEGSDGTDAGASAVTSTRHMRFVYNSNTGQVQSLAAVLDQGGDDVMVDHPFCLTFSGNQPGSAFVYLAKCSSDMAATGGSGHGREMAMMMVDDPIANRQQFEAFGTVGPFLTPLQLVWGYDDQVALAYQAPMLDGTDESSTIAIQVAATTGQDGYDKNGRASSTFTTLLETDNNCGGVVVFSPSTYGIDGGMNASLVVVAGSTDDSTGQGNQESSSSSTDVPIAAIATATASFAVTQEKAHVGCGMSSSSSSLSTVGSATVGIAIAAIAAVVVLLFCAVRIWSSAAAARDRRLAAGAAIINNDDAKTVDEYDDDRDNNNNNNNNNCNDGDFDLKLHKEGVDVIVKPEETSTAIDDDDVDGTSTVGTDTEDDSSDMIHINGNAEKA